MTPDAVHRWAAARRVDILTREHGNSLRVGARKPLGSRGYGPGFSGALRAGAGMWAHRGPGVRFQSYSGAGGGYWLYAYHEPSLRALLLHWGDLLDFHGWPREPAAFVDRARAEMVPPGSALYGLVADAYGDRFNPGRSDVHDGMGVLPTLLLDVYAEQHGEPDPSFVYFAAAGIPLPPRYAQWAPPEACARPGQGMRS